MVPRENLPKTGETDKKPYNDWRNFKTLLYSVGRQLPNDNMIQKKGYINKIESAPHLRVSFELGLLTYNLPLSGL